MRKTLSLFNLTCFAVLCALMPTSGLSLAAATEKWCSDTGLKQYKNNSITGMQLYDECKQFKGFGKVGPSLRKMPTKWCQTTGARLNTPINFDASATIKGPLLAACPKLKPPKQWCADRAWWEYYTKKAITAEQLLTICPGKNLPQDWCQKTGKNLLNNTTNDLITTTQYYGACKTFYGKADSGLQKMPEKWCQTTGKSIYKDHTRPITTKQLQAACDYTQTERNNMNEKWCMKGMQLYKSTTSAHITGDQLFNECKQFTGKADFSKWRMPEKWCQTTGYRLNTQNTALSEDTGPLLVACPKLEPPKYWCREGVWPSYQKNQITAEQLLTMCPGKPLTAKWCKTTGKNLYEGKYITATQYYGACKTFYGKADSGLLKMPEKWCSEKGIHLYLTSAITKQQLQAACRFTKGSDPWCRSIGLRQLIAAANEKNMGDIWSDIQTCKVPIMRACADMLREDPSNQFIKGACAWISEL